MKAWLLVGTLTALAAHADTDGRGGWAYYGGDADGIRYSSQNQITPANVEQLELAWRYSTGEVERRGPELITNSSTQTTPILFEDSLLFCTPFNRIVALDPATGRERWVFDAEVDLNHPLPFHYNCRGVSGWRDAKVPANAACATRVFMGTNDTRLFAVDARTGNPCEGFGEDGAVEVPQPRPHQFPGEVKLMSAPLVVNDRVVVGSFVMDNLSVEAPYGTVHAYDARTGAALWSFDPIPRDPEDPARGTWLENSAERAGAANVWSTMVADEVRDLIFAPVSSAAPDFWGGERPGDNRYSSSIVALRGETGEVAWDFQIVHHDIWDYDMSSPPMLIDLPGPDATIPAVVQNTKQGFVFVLHRETGEPLFELEERRVPGDALPGEWLSPTQPFPVAPPPLVPLELTPEDAWGFTPWDRYRCRKKIEQLRFEGIYTPPTTAPGTILWPSSAGGMNWGGPAYDPNKGLMIVNTNRVPQVVSLVPREEIPEVVGISLVGGKDVAAQAGTPYGVSRDWLLSPLGAPCVAPPWGELVAVDMTDGSIRWRVPLGSIEKHLPIRIKWNLGTPNLGGPVITAGGLIFIAATMDGFLRAFDLNTGEELWREEMPAGTQATPMTYAAGGRQFVVMVTGHHLWFDSPAGDEVVAYALPEMD